MLNPLLMGQEYFNQIIPFTVANPTTAGLYLNTYDSEEFLIPLIYVGPESALIKINENKDYQIYFYDYFDFSFMPLVNIDGRSFLYGKDRSQNNDLRCMELNAEFDIKWLKQYSSLGERNFPTYSMGLDNYIYVSYIDDFEGGDHREIAIKKIDTLGNEVWSKNFNKNIELSYAWEIDNTQDANILIAAGVHYYEKFGRFSQITKIDTSGEIIWTYEGDEPFENGAVPLWIAELSNDNIVMSYYISGNQSPDTRLLWIDKNGNYVKEQLIDVPIRDEMYYSQVEAGRGEYFYGYGIYRFNDDDTVHGIITKFDNDGNIIWEHLYQHESFAEAKDQNSIKDIIELDNGDIVVLGDLSHLGEDTEIWLFKIDENGCFGTESCDEKLVLTNVDDTYFDPTLKIYPNPGTDIIHIVSEDRRMIDARFSIYNLSGQQIEKYTLSQMQNEINVSGLTSQIYIYQIEDKKGEVIGTGKFVKE